jgi:hypothetical protein
MSRANAGGYHLGKRCRPALRAEGQVVKVVNRRLEELHMGFSGRRGDRLARRVLSRAGQAEAGGGDGLLA